MKNACIENICNKIIYIKVGVCIKNAYFKIVYINNTYISSIDGIEYLKIYL